MAIEARRVDRESVAGGISRRRIFLYEMSVPLLILLLAVVFAAVQPRFASLANLQNLGRQASILSILAAGEMLPILTGGFDFSIGPTVSSVSIVTALMANEIGVGPAFVAGVIFGAVVGTINGIVIARFLVSPFVVTLGMYSLTLGMGLTITQGQSIRDVPSGYEALGLGFVGPVAMPTVIAAVALFFTYFLLHFSRFGRYIYAIGGNERTAVLSGIDVPLYKMLAYTFCGAMAGLSAVVLSSRVGSGDSNLGLGMDLQAIAAVIVGGVSIAGGEGGITNLLLGVGLLSILSNGLNLSGVASYPQLMITGGVILLAIVLNQLRRGGGS